MSGTCDNGEGANDVGKTQTSVLEQKTPCDVCSIPALALACPGVTMVSAVGAHLYEVFLDDVGLSNAE